MVDEELDRSAVRAVGMERLVLIVLATQLLVKLDELERLVLNVGEEVVLADEGEDVRVLELEEVREGLAWLAVHDVAVPDRSQSVPEARARCCGRTAQRCSS